MAANDTSARQLAMATLAHASETAICALLSTLELPAGENLREPEPGLVMVRGRIGGDGAPFNLGEATVSRAAVKLGSGEIGFGYTLGRSYEKARLIALCDALIQSKDYREVIETKVIAPLQASNAHARRARSAQTAATRVEFYTMVRGES